LQESFELSQDDRLLIDALQIAPRATWAAVGEALGVTPVTAARRWQRLSDAGAAWVTIAPGMAYREEQLLAYLEITCPPAHRLSVAHELASHHLAMTVELTTGAADILVTLAAANLDTLSHYLLDHISTVEHVLTTRARISTRLYTEGSAWRLGELPREMSEAMRREDERQRGEPGPDSPIPMTASTKAMLARLAVDGRASYIELADVAGISPTTARRQMSRLLHSQVVIPRTDLSAVTSGWPVQVYLWANAPVDVLAESAKTLSRLRQTRLCASLTAGPNLVMGVWLRTVEEVHRLELAIAAKLPRVEILDRLVVLRTVKRMGRLLDSSGRATGVIPINIWDDLLPHTTKDVLAP
jgi:DNA-binding Lrp family transcriptional regulator